MMLKPLIGFNIYGLAMQLTTKNDYILVNLCLLYTLKKTYAYYWITMHQHQANYYSSSSHTQALPNHRLSQPVA
jgi:hypothetical protein